MINASCLLVVASAACSADAGVSEIGLSFLSVGDPGNPAYQDDRFHTYAINGRGSVGHEFRISRSETSTPDYLAC